jgi:hypothetical protein
MDYKVLITGSALRDLSEIVKFVALDDPQAARKLGENLINRALSLEHHRFNLARRMNPRERQSPDWHNSRSARKAVRMRQIKAKLL